MICPNCKEENLDNVSSCKKCGKSFKKNTNSPTKEPIIQEEKIVNKGANTTICFNCNNEIDADLYFCNNCKLPVKESKKLFTFYNFCIVSTILGIAIFIFYIIPLHKELYSSPSGYSNYSCTLPETCFIDAIIPLIKMYFFIGVEFLIGFSWIVYFLDKKAIAKKFSFNNVKSK